MVQSNNVQKARTSTSFLEMVMFSPALRKSCRMCAADEMRSDTTSQNGRQLRSCAHLKQSNRHQRTSF